MESLISGALPVLSVPQKESALAVAAHLVHADRLVTAEESALLDKLAAEMNLPGDEALMVIRAIAALNRTSLDT